MEEQYATDIYETQNYSGKNKKIKKQEAQGSFKRYMEEQYATDIFKKMSLLATRVYASEFWRYRG